VTIHFATNERQKQVIVEEILNNPKPIRVEIEEGDIRSIKANARYWAGVVTATQNHYERQGKKYSKEAIHHMFKVEVFGKKIEEINGKIYEREARSKKMTPKQFMKLTEKAEFIAINDIGVDPAEIDFHASQD
jgi:hypothetical protein